MAWSQPAGGSDGRGSARAGKDSVLTRAQACDNAGTIRPPHRCGGTRPNRVVALPALSDAGFPGDTIRVETGVAEARPRRPRRDDGIIVFEHPGYNPRDDLVMTCQRSSLMRKRPAG